MTCEEKNARRRELRAFRKERAAYWEAWKKLTPEQRLERLRQQLISNLTAKSWIASFLET